MPFGSRGRSVAITGACGYLGTRLIQAFEEDSRYERIVALDVRRPSVPLAKTQFHRVDLTLPTAGAMVASALANASVDTVVHLAFLYEAAHRSEWVHELESVGTMHVLDACAETGVRSIVHWSQTWCYGARPDHPNYLTEDHPLDETSRSPYIVDKIDAERQVVDYGRQHSDVAVAVLRTAPMVARGIQTVATRYLSMPVVATVMGYDPLIQCVYGEDVVDMFKLAVDRSVDGTYNVVGRQVLPLKTFLAVLEKPTLPIPMPAMRLGTGLLWSTQFGRFPSEFVDYLRYLCVADGGKASRELGWVARFSMADMAIELRMRRGRGPRSGSAIMSKQGARGGS